MKIHAPHHGQVLCHKDSLKDAGPSDGIVLVGGALQAPKDARVTHSELRHCNPIELIKGKQAQEKICEFLKDDANQ